MGIVGKCFEGFQFWSIWSALRNLDDQYVLRGEREHFIYAHPIVFFLNTAYARAISRLSESGKIHVLSCNIDCPDPEAMFAFTMQCVVIEVRERTSAFPEPKTFKKYSTKNT